VFPLEIFPSLNGVISIIVTKKEDFEVLVNPYCLDWEAYQKVLHQRFNPENGKAVIKDECNGCEDLVETYPKNAIKLTIPY